MILRLIINEFTTRGWLSDNSIRPYTVYSSSVDVGGADETVDTVMIPTQYREAKYHYSDHPSASFILDGFPRTAQQAVKIDELIPINMAIHVHTPFEVIMERITNRWVHPPSGRTYNTTFNPPKVQGKDDTTGEDLVQRDDDKEEVWKALGEQLSRRWELLGVCHAKTGDRKVREAHLTLLHYAPSPASIAHSDRVSIARVRRVPQEH